MTQKKKIVGRYAPSPTGELHLGNLRTALLAWLKARMDGGQFLLRMEDLDQPRVVPGSADRILYDLEWLGLTWDGEVLYQSNRTDAYRDALQSLDFKNLVYPCFCSRKDILNALSAPHARASVYPGTCRTLDSLELAERLTQKRPALRVKVPSSLSKNVGDFVIKRADGLHAYQLAVVVDDLFQGVNQVVRGADLFDSCSRQRYLATVLATDSELIDYLHAPMMCDAKGDRLAKRDGSASITLWRQSGRSAEQLIAHLFSSLGFQQIGGKISLNELMGRIKSDDLDAVWLNP